MSDQTDTVREIERVHERAITEHVNCKTGDRDLGPCAIDDLRDIALRLAGRVTNLELVERQETAHCVRLREENASLKAEVERLEERVANRSAASLMEP